MRSSTFFTFVLLGLFGLSLHCGGPSWDFDFTSVSQCSTNQECEVILGTEPGLARCGGGICQAYLPSPSGGTPPLRTCETTLQCNEEHAGRGDWACPYPKARGCVQLSNDVCTVSRNWDRMVGGAPPVFVGAVLALDRRRGDGLPFPSPYDEDEMRGMSLAFEEWETQAGGILMAGQAKPQPIVVVTCNSKNDGRRIGRALDHLEYIGAASVVFSDEDDAKVARLRLANRKLTAICTGCDPMGLEGTTDPKVFYPTRPHYGATVAPLVGEWLKETEGRVRSSGGPANGPNLRVLYLAPQTLVGTVQATSIAGGLSMNGAPATAQPADYKRIDVPVTTPDLDILASSVAAFQPDVILTATGPESLKDYVSRIELAWHDGVPRPRYMLVSDAFAKNVIGVTVQGNEDLRRRVTGFRTASAPENDTVLAGFIERFKIRYGQEPLSASAYEASYLLGHAMVAMTNTRSFSGPLSAEALSRAFADVTDPASPRIIETDPLGILDGTNFLRSAPQKPIRLRGAYSDFGWDTSRRAITVDAVLYCPVVNDQGAIELRTAMRYRREAAAIEAPFDETTCGW
ncbi:MAG: hypothetical protein U0174_27875 [Polyangiaceae bacterium]